MGISHNEIFPFLMGYLGGWGNYADSEAEGGYPISDPNAYLLGGNMASSGDYGEGGWVGTDTGSDYNLTNDLYSIPDVPYLDPSGGISVDVTAQDNVPLEGPANSVPADTQLDYQGGTQVVDVSGGSIPEVPLETTDIAQQVVDSGGIQNQPYVVPDPGIIMTDFTTLDTWNNPTAPAAKSNSFLDDMKKVIGGVGKIISGVTGKTSGATGGNSGGTGGFQLPSLPKSPAPTPQTPKTFPSTTPATQPITPKVPTTTPAAIQVAGYSFSPVAIALAVVVVLLTFMIAFHGKGD